MEMPPVSKVTPLPISARWSAGSGFVRRVLHDDQRGRVGAALGDAEKRAHAELAHAVLIEHFAGEAAGFGHFAGAVGEGQRGEEIRGLDGDVAGQVGALRR